MLKEFLVPIININNLFSLIAKASKVYITVFHGSLTEWSS